MNTAPRLITDEELLQLGLAAIKDRFPHGYEMFRPYRLYHINGEWAVMGHTLTMRRGGGTPTAVLDRYTGNVTKVYMAR